LLQQFEWVTMLQKLGDHITVCKLRAAECEALAKDAQDEAMSAQYLEMAKHWNRLAVSYEFNVSLERFLQDVYKKGWPFQLKNLPQLPPRDE
jgi:hypothetical protein